MRFSKDCFAMILGTAALASLSAGCGSSNTTAEKSSTPAPTPAPAAAPAPAPAPKIAVSKAVKAKAATPAPGPNAKKAASFTSVGKGKAVHTGAGHDKGDYLAWSEEIDLADDGTPVTTDVAVDNKHKVLYFARERTFGCANGGTADGSVLMAIFGTGNTLGKPAGSGWYVAELDPGECGVAAAGLYGCRFDVDGNPTQCGSAVIHEDTDEVDITEVTPGAGPGGATK